MSVSVIESLRQVPGGQLPLKGGHHARLWTFKMDPKQVIILRFFPP